MTRDGFTITSFPIVIGLGITYHLIESMDDLYQ